MTALKRTFAALVTLVTTLALAGLAALPAQSAPAVPSFTLPIDGYAPYVREDTCSPTPKPGAVEMVELIKATYGTTVATNIVRKCSASISGHEEGRSIDWMTSVRKPVQKAMGDDFVAWLLAPDAKGNAFAMARRLGVSYVIWDSRIITITSPRAAWREYSTCLTSKTSPTYDTTCHRDHVHISLGWPGARGETSWYQQAKHSACKVQTPAVKSAPKISSRTTSGRDGTARVSSTQAGASAQVGSARVGSARVGSARVGSARVGSVDSTPVDDPSDANRPTAKTQSWSSSTVASARIAGALILRSECVASTQRPTR